MTSVYGNFNILLGEALYSSLQRQYAGEGILLVSWEDLSEKGKMNYSESALAVVQKASELSLPRP